MMNEEDGTTPRTGVRIGPTAPVDNIPLPHLHLSPEGASNSSRRCLRCPGQLCNQIVTIVTYPFILILTVVSLFIIIFFCIFPTVVFMILGICMYYCCMDDPIPIHLLLRYMFAPDPDENNMNGVHGGRASAQSRRLIESKLIIRRLVEISECDVQDADGVAGRSCDSCFVQDYPRRHPFPITVMTDNRCLHFSELVVAQQTTDGDANNPTGKKLASDESSDDENDHGDNHVDASEPVATVLQYQHLADPELIPSRGDATDNTDGDGGDDSTKRKCSDQSTNVALSNDCSEDFQKISQENGADVSQEFLAGGTIGMADIDTEIPTGQHLEMVCKTCDVDEIKKGNDVGPRSTKTGNAEPDYFGLDEHVRDRGITCDICLLEYEVGDEVAWSPNSDCTHTYHKDCILDWLIRKPTCPTCRHDYLKGGKDENV